MTLAETIGHDGEKVMLIADYYDEICVVHYYADGTRTEQIHPTIGTAIHSYARMVEFIANNQWEQERNVLPERG